MCSGGRLVADIVAGTYEQPLVPELAESLTMTAEGAWVVWAYKLAREGGDRFLPLTGRGSYPADAVAECLTVRGPRRWWQDNAQPGGHTAPQPSCTCGFHALSAPLGGAPAMGLVRLTVALSGRVLVFETGGAELLFRAERQTVVRVERPEALWDRRRRRPDDPEGRLARQPAGLPSGAGPARLALPSQAVRVAVRDDAGWCRVTQQPSRAAGASELVEA
jgi:hypothetical protein